MTEEPWHMWLWRSIFSLFVALVGFSTLYTAVRIGRVYELSRQVEAVISEQKALRVELEAQNRSHSARVDQIEQVLFGEVLAKLAVDKRAIAVELWQKNRDKELRDRIQQLERWRSAIDRERQQ